MKITCFFILAFSLGSYASGSAQEVSLDVKDRSLKAVLKEINKQSGYHFFYNEEVVKDIRIKDLQLAETDINKVLHTLLGPYHLDYQIRNKNITIAATAPAASDNGAQRTSQSAGLQRTITGRVTDSQNNPLEGVSVVVRGSNIGTATDQNGAFSINTGQSAVTLVFSIIGYQTQEVSATSSVVNITMEENLSDIDEVVVLGYSAKRQSELSSAVAVVNEEQLKGVQTNDLGAMLQGKVSGLVVSNTSGRPGQETSMVIRGVGSIGAGYEPLYVVDGVIGGTANPNDIATVTVLKDAAATGLYGSRASNGVIVITTKTGAEGKTRVNYNGSYGVSFHNYGNIEVMNSAQLYDFQREGYFNYFNDKVAEGDPAFVGQSFDQYLETVLPASLLNVDTDWQSLLTRVGQVNNHHLSVSGGNDKTTFYVGGNFFDETGTLISLAYQNVSLRANLTHKISDRFTLTARINGRQYRQPNEPRYDGAFNQFYLNMPWDSPYESDGITPYNPARSGSTWRGNNRTNHFYEREHYSDITKGTGFGTDLRLDVKITDWLSFSTTNNIGFSHTDWTQLLDKYHQAATADLGTLSQTYSYSKSFLTSNLLTMNKSFGDHNVSGILGQEYNYSNWSSTGAVGMDMVPGLTALNSAGQPKSVSGSLTETGFLSYFGQADYNYQGKYFLVGSLRRDASSRFGANNQWGTFYSVGASWMINRESFLSTVSWIDLLRLRASYGTTGNANIANYLALGTFSFSAAGTYDGNAGARPARLPNPNLSWEMAHTSNVGVEFGIFNRARIEVDFYHKLTKDLLQSVPLSAASGFANQQQNVGSITNTGVDINLSAALVKKPNFNWDASFNVNFNKNRVVDLDKGNDIFSTNMIIREGLPLRYFYMRKWRGVDSQTGSPLWERWEDEAGNIIHGADRKEPAKVTTTDEYNMASNLLIGSAYPEFVGGIRNDLQYKNISLSILSSFSYGQSVYFGQRTQLDSDGEYFTYNQRQMMSGWTRWRGPGDDATHPRILPAGNKQAGNVSSRFIEDASYFRIQNIRLGYTFPRTVYGLTNLALFASIDNPWIFTNFSGADPDSNIETPQITSDANSARYAPTRKVLFGINFDL